MKKRVHHSGHGSKTAQPTESVNTQPLPFDSGKCSRLNLRPWVAHSLTPCEKRAQESMFYILEDIMHSPTTKPGRAAHMTGFLAAEVCSQQNASPNNEYFLTVVGHFALLLEAVLLSGQQKHDGDICTPPTTDIRDKITGEAFLAGFSDPEHDERIQALIRFAETVVREDRRGYRHPQQVLRGA